MFGKRKCLQLSSSSGPDKKERTKGKEHVKMQKGANFTVVSASLLIGLNIKFYAFFAKQHVYYSLVF